MADSPSPASVTSISLPATDHASGENLFATSTYHNKSDGASQRLWFLLDRKPERVLRKATQPMTDGPGVKCNYIKVAPHGSFAWVTMTVGSGENEKKLQVQHGMISHHSTVFANELRDDPDDFGFLPDQDPDTFKLVIDWMYARGFWDPETSKSQKTPLSLRQTLSVYFCAFEHGMPFLRNEALSLIYQMTVDDEKELFDHAELIYENTEPKSPNWLASPLRRFLVDVVVNRCCFTAESPVLYDKLQTDMLVQLQMLRRPPGACMYKEEWIKQMNKDFCHLYHDHKDIDDLEDDPDYLDDADASSTTSESSDDSGSSLGSKV